MVLFKNNTFYITAGKEFDLLNHCRPRKMSKIKFIASGADPGFIKMLRTLAKGMGMGGVGRGGDWLPRRIILPWDMQFPTRRQSAFLIPRL